MTDLTPAVINATILKPYPSASHRIPPAAVPKSRYKKYPHSRVFFFKLLVSVSSDLRRQFKKNEKKKKNRCARARGQVRGALKLCLYANLLFRPREEKKGPRCKGERAELRVAHILVAEMTAHLLVHCCKADERSPPKKIKN